MNKRHKLGWPELVLLLVPALALVVWGVWLQSRGPSKPFKLVINELKVTPLPKGPTVPPQPNTRGVQVIVFIGHEDPVPDWWGNGVNAPYSKVSFTGKSGKDNRYTSVGGSGGYSGVFFDRPRRQYTFTYTGNFPKDPKFLKQATCHVFANLETSRVPHKKLATVKASIPAQKFN